MAAGEAIWAALRRVNVDALPPLTAGVAIWLVVSYLSIGVGFALVGAILAIGLPERMNWGRRWCQRPWCPNGRGPWTSRRFGQ